MVSPLVSTFYASAIECFLQSRGINACGLRTHNEGFLGWTVYLPHQRLALWLSLDTVHGSLFVDLVIGFGLLDRGKTHKGGLLLAKENSIQRSSFAYAVLLKSIATIQFKNFEGCLIPGLFPKALTSLWDAAISSQEKMCVEGTGIQTLPLDWFASVSLH